MRLPRSTEHDQTCTLLLYVLSRCRSFSVYGLCYWDAVRIFWWKIDEVFRIGYVRTQRLFTVKIAARGWKERKIRDVRTFHSGGLVYMTRLMADIAECHDPLIRYSIKRKAQLTWDWNSRTLSSLDSLSKLLFTTKKMHVITDVLYNYSRWAVLTTIKSPLTIIFIPSNIEELRMLNTLAQFCHSWSNFIAKISTWSFRKYSKVHPIWNR